MSPDPEPRRPRMTKAHIATYAVAAILLAAVSLFAAAAADLVQADPVCGGCHGPATAALSQDVHLSLACYDCHSEDGFLQRGARLLRDTTSVFRLGDEAEGSVPDRACLVCHDRLFEDVVEVEGIRMDHASCLDATTRCTTCHSDTGHGIGGPGRVVAMSVCARCHDGTLAPDGCETCHTGDRERTDETGEWAVTHGPTWRATHGMGDLEWCGICHDVEDCSRCHLPVPHGDTWPSSHGRLAVSEGLEACTGCHIEALCEGCHGIDMPHREGFLVEHSSIAESADDPVCASCHSARDCGECHLEHVHPGLPPEVIERLGP